MGAEPAFSTTFRRGRFQRHGFHTTPAIVSSLDDCRHGFCSKPAFHELYSWFYVLSIVVLAAHLVPHSVACRVSCRLRTLALSADHTSSHVSQARNRLLPQDEIASRKPIMNISSPWSNPRRSARVWQSPRLNPARPSSSHRYFPAPGSGRESSFYLASASAPFPDDTPDYEQYITCLD